MAKGAPKARLEHSEQVTLMRWWSLTHQSFGISEQLLFAIPNGGLRNVITAKNMKAEGVRAGVPDLFLAVSRGDSHGLFIEMKRTKGGRVSDSQESMLGRLAEQGYEAIVCKGWVAAKEAIEAYLQK